MPVPAATDQGLLDGPHGKTWWRVTGQLGTGLTPLVVLHGGPGVPHEYTLRMARLAEHGRAVLHYDQLGCGRSTHLPEKGAEFWDVQLFLDELDRVLAGLGIADGYHLLGQSWGGMLAAEHAVRRPAGLRGLVIADSPASMDTWLAEANRLRELLPPDVQATLLAHEQAGTTDSEEYAAAEKVFYDRHVCRVVPNPEEVAASFASLAEDPTVYHTMNGPSEFHVVGTMKGWTVEDRLDQVRATTLVVNGRFDEATDLCVAPYVAKIPGVRWVTFEESSHLPHVEEEERFLEVVGAFLTQCDETATATPTEPEA